MSKTPPQKDKKCYGIDLRSENKKHTFTLKYVIEFYKKHKETGIDKNFWTSPKFLDKLAGTPVLREQINKGLSETEIRKSWQSELSKYKIMRKKYLLYPDFE